jgi:hypothetical protein
MKRLLITGAIAVLTATLARPSHAGPCGYSQITDPDDSYVMSRWNCGQGYINFYWWAYDYDSYDWDGGWGYSAPCDMSLPLARVFNANWTLDYAAPNFPLSLTDFTGNILRWGGNYAIREIDELDGKECGQGAGADGPLATTVHGSPIDDYTQLWPKFFYNLTVVERAGTLLHEARHAAGVSHLESDSSCPRGGSCDYTYGDGGANHYQVRWLAEFASLGTQHPITMRRRAANRANIILRGGYRYDKGLVIPTP